MAVHDECRRRRYSGSFEDAAAAEANALIAAQTASDIPRQTAMVSPGARWGQSPGTKIVTHIQNRQTPFKQGAKPSEVQARTLRHFEQRLDLRRRLRACGGGAHCME